MKKIKYAKLRDMYNYSKDTSFKEMVTDDFKDFSQYRYSELLAQFLNLWNDYYLAIPLEFDIIDDVFNDKDTKEKLYEYVDNSLKDIIGEWKSYYNEMITNYSKDFDYATGITNSIENESINVDLPNKKVDSESIYSYPSSGDKGKTTYVDNSKFLSMKRQYLSQIRDLYKEFAKKFKDMFMHLYIEEEVIYE